MTNKKEVDRRLLPKRIWCPYHFTWVRGCEHRDEGLLD